MTCEHDLVEWAGKATCRICGVTLENQPDRLLALTHQIVEHYSRVRIEIPQPTDQPIRHIEMYDGQVFCGASDHRYGVVPQRDWHDDTSKIRDGTCIDCLRRINVMGLCADVTLWERYRK